MAKQVEYAGGREGFVRPIPDSCPPEFRAKIIEARAKAGVALTEEEERELVATWTKQAQERLNSVEL